MAKRLNREVWLLALAAFLLLGSPARAEMYVAGQVGVTLPNDASSIDYSTNIFPGQTFKGNDLDLQTSVVYGAKLGYYFESLKWLGVETEVYNTTPHVKQQNINVGPFSLGVQPGSYLRVLNWSPITIVTRFQMGKVEPYAGVGLGLYFARLKDPTSGDSTSSTTPGLNTQVGLRYRITDHVAVFGEWKYNYTRVKFDETPTAFLKTDATYTAHHFVFGLGYHF
jgi:opacity protein-like surface antigen